MAQAFSAPRYFKKIYSADILIEFYKQHDIVTLFEITESTPRKNVINIFTDFYTTLPPEQKIDIEKELTLIASVSTKYTPMFLSSLLEEKNISKVTQLECISDYDTVLYYYVFHKEIFDEIFFFHDFYSKRGYMLYEAKEVDLVSADLAMTELTREFTRLANKEDNATECDFSHKILHGLLYVTMTFKGKQMIGGQPGTVAEAAENSTVRRRETVKIVYLPNDKEVLITYTGSKYDKLIFLDTFLRVVCKSGYEGKVESYNLASFVDETFDFTKTNKGVPLLTWKIQGITLALGGSEKQKKKVKLMIPSSPQEYGMSPLRTTLDELELAAKAKQCRVENVSLSFSFSDSEKATKTARVTCSLSTTKSSLCSLFPYDRLARTLLKQAHIEQGFVTVEKKEKENVTKKWEV
jgi:hypothetical protein